MSIIMIFVDGIGIGDLDAARNPFARFPSPFFPLFKAHGSKRAPHGGFVVPTDPTMNVPGLPQSATGQTALLTGVNAAKKLGHHRSGFPSPTLRALIETESIFLKLQELGKDATFANAFTPEYFQRPDRLISATTWSVRASQFPFRMVDRDLCRDRAISHDLTNNFLADLGYDVPIRTPERSAEILVEVAGSVDLCLFEFILTDVIGHRQDMARAGRELGKLTAFLGTVLDQIDLDRNSVLLTSDHGNFEDLGVSTHTNNFVPTILWGNDSDSLAERITRIQDVPTAILSCA